MWIQRDHLSNEQLPMSDRDLIMRQNRQRLENHNYSEQSKAPQRGPPVTVDLEVGELVYNFADKNRNKSHDRYLVTSLENKKWCYMRKFVGSQLRAASYKVRICDCYT